MKSSLKALAAGLASLVAASSLAAGAAEAKTWRQWAHQYGGGYYVDKYVGEDKNGRAYYKGSKHDKWSGDYYDRKTGKWTGKKYDGEWGGESYSSSNSGGKKRSAKKSGGSTAVAARKSQDTSAYVGSGAEGSADAAKASVKKSSKSVRTTRSASDNATKAAATAAAGGAAGEFGSAEPPVETSAKSAAAKKAEVYGPPMPAEVAAR